jgi:hypothetical protein
LSVAARCGALKYTYVLANPALPFSVAQNNGFDRQG